MRRLLDAHWVNNHAAYRCRHGFRSARSTAPDRPRVVYIHESKAIRQAALWLGMSHANPHAVIEALLEQDVQITCAIGGTLTIHGISPTGTLNPVASIPRQRLAAKPPPNDCINFAEYLWGLTCPTSFPLI
jgi:hypothetical protein